jgi:hypothetical protein
MGGLSDCPFKKYRVIGIQESCTPSKKCREELALDETQAECEDEPQEPQTGYEEESEHRQSRKNKQASE